MAQAGQAPQTTGKTVLIKIRNDGTVDLPTANAVVGDTVEFHNLASTAKVIQFLDNGVQLSIALEIQNGGKSEFIATVAGTVTYSIGLGRGQGGGGFSPDDDTYQVIVGSSDPGKR